MKIDQQYKNMNKEFSRGHREGMLSAIHLLRNLTPDGVDFTDAAKFLEQTQKNVDIALESINKQIRFN